MSKREYCINNVLKLNLIKKQCNKLKIELILVSFTLGKMIKKLIMKHYRRNNKMHWVFHNLRSTYACLCMSEVIGKIKCSGHKVAVDQKFQKMIQFDYYLKNNFDHFWQTLNVEDAVWLHAKTLVNGLMDLEESHGDGDDFILLWCHVPTSQQLFLTFYRHLFFS